MESGCDGWNLCSHLSVMTARAVTGGHGRGQTHSRWALDSMKTLNPGGLHSPASVSADNKTSSLSHFLCPAAKCILTDTPRMPL